jgi:dTDP-3-amino-2,3,6-trideoxy-4-keto-D-glucose/dTDP-3-amino-3,4,6-trideoxy-alpha-D-glucose/dTDP-2,6-dideoxy-D-kanosamine transaminase
MSRINVWGYLAEYEREKEDLLDGVRKVFESGHLILGDSVTRFEEAFARYCSVRHGVGVDNGTNALMLAMRALGIGAEDEVITVPNTAAPTVVAIRQIGARPRFVDIDPSTYLMDTSSLEEAVTARTRCILPVHLFGQCVDMEVILDVARRHRLFVLEDCAQSHGARYGDRVCGGLGDAAAFSFYPTKVLGAYGDAGIVITNDELVAERVRRLRYYGMAPGRYFVTETLGYNARLDTVQAEILLRRLRRLDQYIERRRELGARYAEQLEGTGLVLPSVCPKSTHVYYLYVVRHPQRDEIIEAMRERDIFLNVSYPWPCHLQGGFADLEYRTGDFPQSEAAAREIFSLPMYPSLSDSEQERVCMELRDVLSKLPREVRR